MKAIISILIFATFFCIYTTKALASYDPVSVSNNKFGIHILFPSEVSEASYLVNSSGGDWGYVTIPIQANDRNLDKWQAFMNDCAKYHLIPIIRIATIADYFNKGSWSKPDAYDIIDFANFLNDLNWPTKNRYVVIFNEPNRSDEWGGNTNPSEYAQILDFATKVFKERNQEFFLISAGLDNAASDSDTSYSNFSFIQDMEISDPGIFSKVDAIASHSYPNPAFSMPPSTRREGIYTFHYEAQLINYYANKTLPVFITETGWSSDKVSQEQQAQYYIQSFTNYWNDSSIIAVTPFIFTADQGPFTQFSFVTNGNKNKIYYALYNFKKEKGVPQLNPKIKSSVVKSNNLPTEQFKSSGIINIFKKIGTKQKEFFKWLLGV